MSLQQTGRNRESQEGIEGSKNEKWERTSSSFSVQFSNSTTIRAHSKAENCAKLYSILRKAEKNG